MRPSARHSWRRLRPGDLHGQRPRRRRKKGPPAVAGAGMREHNWSNNNTLRPPARPPTSHSNCVWRPQKGAHASLAGGRAGEIINLLAHSAARPPRRTNERTNEQAKEQLSRRAPIYERRRSGAPGGRLVNKRAADNGGRGGDGARRQVALDRPTSCGGGGGGGAASARCNKFAQHMS